MVVGGFTAGTRGLPRWVPRAAVVVVVLIGAVLIGSGIGALSSSGRIDDLRHAAGAHTVSLSVDSDRVLCGSVQAGSGSRQSRRDCRYAVTGHYVDTDGRTVTGVALYPDATTPPGASLPVIVSPGNRTVALDASASASSSRVLGVVTLVVGALLVLGVAALVVRRRLRR